MKVMKLVECGDWDYAYGCLICENDEISEEDIQEKIYEIKNAYYEEDSDGYWDIEMVMDDFPPEWKVWFADLGVVEI